jgi:hypothetical protein
MKRIIHLSNIHVGQDDCDEKFRMIIDNITFLRQITKNYINLNTGDIVEELHWYDIFFSAGESRNDQLKCLVKKQEKPGIAPLIKETSFKIDPLPKSFRYE